VLNLKRKRNKLQNKLRGNKEKATVEQRNDYYKALNEFLTELQKFKAEQWQKFLNGLEGKPLTSKPFWKRINRVRNKRKTNNIPTLINKENDQELTTDEMKANFFGKKLAKTFSKDDPVYNSTFEEVHLTTVTEWHNEFCDAEKVKTYEKGNPISLRELNKAIRSLNNKNSLDADSISNNMIKHTPHSMREAILTLFNIMLAKHEIPKALKCATITMIEKKGIRSDPSNYRPISITSSLVKLYEKILLNRIWVHLK